MRETGRGQATRQRLLDAAVPLIGEAGWGAVTTRMVAERAGVNQALVHYHFGSVTQLLVAASTGFARQLLAGFAAGLAEQPDVPAAVEWLLAGLDGYADDDPASRTVSETYLAASRLPALRVELAAVVDDFRAEVAGWLRRHGHGADEASAAATLLAATVDGLMLHRGLEPGLGAAGLAGPLRRLLTPDTAPEGAP